jgi:protein phosphatase
VTHLVVACRSHIGNHHPVNQDAGGAWVFSRPDGTPTALLVVADGVSAGAHSEEASRLAVSIVHERVKPVLMDPGRSVEECQATLVEAIIEANASIARRPHGDISSADSTTIVAALAVADRVAGAWVGDSRVYLTRGGSANRLTTDHSWAEGVVSRGLMTAEQAAADPRAHVIMRWLGPPQNRDPGVETFDGRIENGDVLLCCTDGLYMYFAPPYGEEDQIARLLAGHSDLQAALDALIDIALRRGGYDNITAAALRLLDGGLPPDHPTDEIPLLSPS